MRNYARNYFARPENKEKRAKYQRKYIAEHQRHDKEYHKKYNKEYKKNPKYKEYQNVWRKKPKNKLNISVQSLIWQALNGQKAGRKWEDLVGYTLNDLVKHLENQFDDKMSWDNYGKWHVDHKIPRSHFKYETAEDPEFKKCWALDNLQPLWAVDNLKKGNRIKRFKD